MNCDCGCFYSELGYCICNPDKVTMTKLFITGPQGNNEYGMRCSNYVIKDKDGASRGNDNNPE